MICQLIITTDQICGFFDTTQLKFVQQKKSADDSESLLKTTGLQSCFEPAMQ